ncbi:MAG: hypothetical protein CMN76_16185 [Spirochaetaceae bacterium]|nr:hypothetical protein [Spirochaetaceae bacterium]
MRRKRTVFIALTCLAVLQYLSACSTAPLPAPTSYEDACDHYEAQLWEFHRSNKEATGAPTRMDQHYRLSQCSIFYNIQVGDYNVQDKDYDGVIESIVVIVALPGKIQEAWEYYKEVQSPLSSTEDQSIVLTKSEETDTSVYRRFVVDRKRESPDSITLRRGDLRFYVRKLEYGLVRFQFRYSAPVEEFREPSLSDSTLEFFHSLQ